LLPDQKQLILNALSGRGGSTITITAQGHIISAAEPVLSNERKPIGAIYVQGTSQAFNGDILSYIVFLLFTALFWIIVTAPIGALFGVLTTRGLVRRLHRLVSATAQFANGDYTQRVPVTRKDEIGQLESQFNQMAEQLVQSMAQRQALIEQNARLEERTRIEQELSTAHLIQHSLLPKEVPALAGWQIATYYQSAREVGGDLYDFLMFEDGRLGLVIGDVADKGVPAAMVMASTRSMLRAAAQITDSPGEVLARVNNLLYADIPPNMFVTCFYAVLDPGSGKLRYANAGHDLPYTRHADSVYELRATGMPLGLMPEMRYEEKEVIVALDESILFYSDGLVEAHNSEREMFGFPRLQALLEVHADGASLIDFLLSELRSFTGEGWEQEDDMTMLTLKRRFEN
jgi:serine phosphatase RsbU (regulator of sigma subunit)